jgi:hypothetical protein
MMHNKSLLSKYNPLIMNIYWVIFAIINAQIIGLYVATTFIGFVAKFAVFRDYPWSIPDIALYSIISPISWRVTLVLAVIAFD